MFKLYCNIINIRIGVKSTLGGGRLKWASNEYYRMMFIFVNQLFLVSNQSLYSRWESMNVKLA